MPSPNPHAAASTGNWWIVQNASGQRGGPPQLTVVQSATKPQNAVAGPFTSQSAANKALLQRQNQGSFPSIPSPTGIISGWFSSLGADIGSGIEAGIVSMLKDLWNVILGPIEVGVGLTLMVLAVFFYFGGSMGSLGALMA